MTGSIRGRLLRTRTFVAVASGAVVLATGAATGASYAVAQPAAEPTRPGPRGTTGELLGVYDARVGAGGAARAAQLRTASKAARTPAARVFRRALEDDAQLEYDGTTGTVRILQNLDGYLTDRSTLSPQQVVLRYVREHHAGLGLTEGDLDTFRLSRNYQDVAGIRHLSWTQRIGGGSVFGNGLQAAVTADGRLLMLGGSPVSTPEEPSAERPRIGSPAGAIAASRRDTGEATATPGPRDSAERVLFVTRTGTFWGWRTITMSADNPAHSVFDAASGRLLYRRPLSSDAGSREGSRGKAVRYFPGHRPGGRPKTVRFTKRGWLDARATRLFGNNTHAYSDVNDDDTAQRREEAPPKSGQRWDYRLQQFHLENVSFCDNPYPCSWNPDEPFSWRVNREQNITQVFYFVNNWHDHLLRSPIGFTEAAGNFQQRNFSRQGVGRDFVDAQTDDGANTDHGLPDGAHIDNANMSTPPDGMAPTMQLYLQHQPGTSYPDGDPYAPTNVGDEADTVYHEYTHGLSNRLVVDPSGNSTLGDVQAGAMGEAWSDWYAMDYLVARGLQKDSKREADVVLFQYDGAGAALNRSGPIDCEVGSTSPLCTGGLTGHQGGYTYADYGRVAGAPAVHGDGEIWAQTLWSLRDALRSRASQALVTRAMELAPANPSFLDMRNAILVADTALFDGRHHTAIWRTFASRGMGFLAGSLGGDDTSPGADFSTPPTEVQRGTISGVVTDRDTGEPVSGVPVSLAFQGGASIANPTTITGPDGSYSLGPVPAGTYDKLLVTGGGYQPARRSVQVTAAGGNGDLQLRRDWAAETGGASVAEFNGPDFSEFGCGPAQAIDLSQLSGWVSTTGDDEGTPTNEFVRKFLTVDLGRTIDVTAFGVDPSATCGQGGSASTGAYSIETSPDGTTFTEAHAGTFTAEDLGRINELTPAAGDEGVRFVRINLLGNQTPDFATNCPDGGFSGCSFTDLTELAVFGVPAR
jgi:extracellular elastinolytic metalloproteinase